jgi:hypothetical protein
MTCSAARLASVRTHHSGGIDKIIGMVILPASLAAIFIKLDSIY